MGYLFMGLGGILGLAGFVCWVMIVIKMFQNDKSTLGIITIVLVFCGGIGYLIGLVVGWMNATAWNMKNIVVAYTACLILTAVLYGIGATLMVADAVQNMPEGETQQLNNEF